MDPWLASVLAVLGGILAGAYLAHRLRARDGAGTPAPTEPPGAAYALALERLRELDAERERLSGEEWRSARHERLREAATVLRRAEATGPAIRTRAWPVWVACGAVAFALTAAASSVEWTGAAPEPVATNPHAAVPAESLPTDLPTLNARAYEAILAGDLPAAMAMVERVRQIAPDDPDLQVNVCALRLAVGMIDRAEAGLDEVLASHPDHLRARLWKGVARSERGDAEGARQAWHDVVARDSEGREGRQARAFLADLASATRPGG